MAAKTKSKKGKKPTAKKSPEVVELEKTIAKGRKDLQKVRAAIAQSKAVLQILERRVKKARRQRDDTHAAWRKLDNALAGVYDRWETNMDELSRVRGALREAMSALKEAKAKAKAKVPAPAPASPPDASAT